MATLTIGRLARRSGVSVGTLRFYERQGLLPDPGRNEAGYRYYAADNIDRLMFIKRTKALGFSLIQIRSLLHLMDAGGSRQQHQSRNRSPHRGSGRLKDLTAIKTALEEYSRRCEGQGPLSGCCIVRAVIAAAR